MLTNPRKPKKDLASLDSVYERKQTRTYVDFMRRSSAVNPKALAPSYIPALANQWRVLPEPGPQPIAPYVAPAGYVDIDYVENTP